MHRIGIMTFHAAHNYGSVLQAYATQQVLERLGFANEIINYRLPNQRQYYNHIYSARFGRKNLARRLILLPEHFKRVKRIRRFEAFISERLRLTDREFSTYAQLCDAKLDYPVLLSGSDQVWNRHCQAEFATEPPESIKGYLLQFGRPDARRVAFSSSIGSMTREEMKEFVPALQAYDFLSVRESETADMLSGLLGRTVVNTLDPTLMLDEEDWKLEGTYDTQGGYILVYTLWQYRAAQRMLKAVAEMAGRLKLKVKCIAPFSPVHVPGIEAIPESGPLDFLSLVRGATLVVTDSFHGTAFSINFSVPFYSVMPGSGQEKRKAQLLNRLGLSDRILSVGALSQVKEYGCTFTQAHEELAKERAASLVYLKTALSV